MGYLLSKVSKHNPCWHEILLKLPDLTMFKTLVQVYWLKLIIIALYPFQFKSIRKSFVLIRFADKNLFWHGITLFYYLTSCGQKQPFRGVLIFLPPPPPSPPPPFLKHLKLGRSFLFLKFGQRGVSWKSCSGIGGQLKGESYLWKTGFHIVLSVFLQKSMFSLPLEYFFFLFCQVKIHASYSCFL